MTAVAVSSSDELTAQLERRASEYAKVLPSNITPEHFQRVTVTAVNQNPKLLEADRRSLLNAVMRCAQDGLLPDGRQAVLVVYKSKAGPIAQYQQMVAGIRKLVQQSGEITRFEQTVVYEFDEFTYELGDHPQIKHRPAMINRGNAVLVYSVAQFRDGTLSREVMTVAEIEKVRASSRAANDGPWVDWWDEMARKTVAKRHAKVLPMSNDAADVLARDDEFRPLALPPPRLTESRPRLAERLETLAPHTSRSDESGHQRRRGRPRKDDDADQVPDVPPDDVVDAQPVDGDGEPLTQPSADYLAGVKDALRGATTCVNRDITDDPRRLADWEAGFKSQKHQP